MAAHAHARCRCPLGTRKPAPAGPHRQAHTKHHAAHRIASWRSSALASVWHFPPIDEKTSSPSTSRKQHCQSHLSRGGGGGGGRSLLPTATAAATSGLRLLYECARFLTTDLLLWSAVSRLATCTGYCRRRFKRRAKRSRLMSQHRAKPSGLHALEVQPSGYRWPVPAVRGPAVPTDDIALGSASKSALVLGRIKVRATILALAPKHVQVPPLFQAQTLESFQQPDWHPCQIAMAVDSIVQQNLVTADRLCSETRKSLIRDRNSQIREGQIGNSPDLIEGLSHLGRARSSGNSASSSCAPISQ